MSRLRAGSEICFLAVLVVTRAFAWASAQDISHTAFNKISDAIGPFGERSGYIDGESNVGSVPVKTGQKTDILNSLKPNSVGHSSKSGHVFGQAQAQASSADGSNNYNNQEFNPPGDRIASDSKSAAQALTEAANVGTGKNSQPAGVYPSAESSQTIGQQASRGIGGQFNSGSNPHFPGSNDPGSELSSAQAKTQGQASSQLDGSYNPVLSMYSSEFPSSNFKSGSSSAEAEASSSGGATYPGQYSGHSQASAHADASSHSNPVGPPFAPSSQYPGESYVSGSQAQANAQASSGQVQTDTLSNAYNSGGQSMAHANAIASANSRLVLQNEYILPNSIPGGNSISCSRDGELHYFWTDLSCMVCACVREYGYLTPICVSCSGCVHKPEPPRPPPAHPSPPLPPVPAPISCSPLPSGQPFQNPLHPCQICICWESMNVFGQPDVQIECQNNPQCVLPPDVTPLPPIPDPIPVPLPLCEKFPQNVMFPHPSDACTLCYCSVRPGEYGHLEEHISCQPNPACKEPVPITLPPTPEPVTISPWPVPDPVPPGPLPGPPPHESCRPFAPNQPFQHPWDECQTCVCTEAYSVGLITIEVNCFTKKTCCFEIADASGPVYPGGYIGSAESSAVANAQSNSNRILSFPSGNYIPSNNLIAGGLQNKALAQAIASAQAQNQPAYPGALYPGGSLHPGGNQFIGPVQANYPGDVQPFVLGYGNPILGENQVYGPGQRNVYNAGSQPSTQAQSQADHGYPAYLGYQTQPEEGYTGNAGYPSYPAQGYSSAEAEAEAQAKALSGYNGRLNNYSPGYNKPLSLNPGLYGNQDQNFGYSGINFADAQAKANGDISNVDSLASTNSQANSFANAMSNSYGGNGYVSSPMDGSGYGQVPSSADLYSQPAIGNPYYITPKGGANGFGKRQPAFQGGSSAQAQASAMSMVKNKSGKDEDDNRW